MRNHSFTLTALIYLLLSVCIPAAAQKESSLHRVPSPSAATVKARTEGRESAERALARLRVLRDGWNDVNRQYIRPNFEAGRKLSPVDYEVQYLEARAAVDETLQILPKGELRAALEQAMGLFTDLEQLLLIFNRKTPLTTGVYVADIFPYLKKYDVPYEEGAARGNFGLILHKDFVLSYILPIRFERVNRVEILLGGKYQPAPPPPTYEQMFRVPKAAPAPDRSGVNVEELKGIARQLVEAKLRGDVNRMGVLLDDGFRFHGRGDRQGDKAWFLRSLRADSSVKSFEIEEAQLSFRGESPVLTTVVRYESPGGESKSYNNTFTFVSRGGKWLISKWSSL